MSNVKATEGKLPPHRAGSRSWVLVLVTLGVLAALLGGVAYWRFTLSDRTLARGLAQMRNRAPSLTVSQCVQELVSWAEGCSAMRTLCDASIPRMTRACLAGRDRSSFCAAAGDKTMTTGFGYAECDALAQDRRRKKACAIAYRTIADFCQEQARTKSP